MIIWLMPMHYLKNLYLWVQGQTGPLVGHTGEKVIFAKKRVGIVSLQRHNIVIIM